MLEANTQIPRIGDPAPDFKAVTTHSEEMTFSEWQDKEWVVLFSHPADFTPVCSTELMEFARRSDEFTKMGAKLIGISVDSVHSHLAWLQNLKEKMGVEIPYPMIADINMKVSNLYGMIHPGASSTATVRAVFLIDPKRTVRALVYYPMNVGRNVDEVLRLLTALQTADGNAVATPVNWTPGERVVVPPPKKMADVKERETHKGGDYDYKDFYLCLKELKTPVGAGR
ncbi:MAG: peroxiredoxin [Armatimonadetes bacterium]|nr:peroxiredoxin [Armatimonadota bacterium]